MDVALDLLFSYWPSVAGAFGVAAVVLSVSHVLLFKRDPHAAAGWIGVILLAPVIGVTLYLLIGVNRISRRAKSLQRLLPSPRDVVPPAALLSQLDGDDGHLESLVRFTSREMRRPLVGGNRVRPLENGERAYPEMLAAIDAAERSVTLSTYIFDDDGTGRSFVDALARARERGVEVRVLVDAVGERYSFPRFIRRRLKKRGVPSARFLPTRLPWRFPYSQLRLHKKTLVVDGSVGFTGGMNLRDGHDLSKNPKSPVQDLHFRVDGPVVSQLQESFAEDWLFSTGEKLADETWLPAVAPAGDAFARAITDGPDEDLEHLKWAYMAGLACAQSRVSIVTPYFLPDGPLVGALNSAAMRGVDVEIVLPEKCNLSLPEWASRAMLEPLLRRGCRVFLTPEPFDHSKLMVVDDGWTLLGSGNWDPRSYRLCFELVVECYDRELAAAGRAFVADRVESARELTLAEIERRPLPVKLRDGFARILSPYL